MSLLVIDLTCMFLSKKLIIFLSYFLVFNIIEFAISIISFLLKL